MGRRPGLPNPQGHFWESTPSPSRGRSKIYASIFLTFIVLHSWATTPRSLASLARTHTAYQIEVEQALDTCTFHCRPQGFLEMHRTLSRELGESCLRPCPERSSQPIANAVFLEAWRVMTCLLKLERSNQYDDFRLRICSGEPPQSIEELKRATSVISLIFNDLDTVEVTLDYELFTTVFTCWVSSFLQSSKTKLNCKYLDYTRAETRRLYGQGADAWKMNNHQSSCLHSTLKDWRDTANMLDEIYNLWHCCSPAH